MATTERPKSRLDDGRVNPAYTAWRKRLKEADAEPSVMERAKAKTEVLREIPNGVETFRQMMEEERKATPDEVHSRPSVTVETVLDRIEAEDFQSAAEPEQTTNDDLREPEVAPALEAPSEVLSLLVIREARNSKFVLCALDRKKVAVRLLKRGTGPKLVKKHIKVRLDRKQYLQVP